METISDLIEEKLSRLPTTSGVYIMKNSQAKIIYVGKAINLRNRVRSYFRNLDKHLPKVRALVTHIVDFEYIVTNNELEALILECNLIKKHRPKYNINLKDDKSYPYIKLTLTEDYPRIYATRRVIKDGSKYFGPYANVTAMHTMIKLLKDMFPLRSCHRLGSRPCLQYHIKKCLAPCVGKVSKENYSLMINDVTLFLEGRTEKLVKELKTRMLGASANLEFETAALLRDQLKAVTIMQEQQKAVTDSGDQDIIGFAQNETLAIIQIFFVRSGKLVGRDHFIIQKNFEETMEDIVTSFIKQYYNDSSFVPKEILLPCATTETDLLEEWLSSLKKKTVKILVPKRQAKKDFVNLAIENAENFLREHTKHINEQTAKEKRAVLELQQALGITDYIHRMDCFDISHTQGSETVASMVVFRDGKSSKKDYRKYKLKTVEGKPDDFMSMREVVLRRYSKYENLPDLVIIDGGKGQLSSALEVIRGLGLNELKVIGLAKQFEHIFIENASEPIILKKDSPALFLIQNIRDEAHRFAITYHRKLRSKRNMTSILDHIEGIGEKRKQALWQTFKTLDKIKNATVQELMQCATINSSVAEKVHAFFHKEHNSR